ncbi:MAG: SUF system Fe-S cluster assembly regulator [Alphaproteobacteria bacterium]|nr:SUF system Fe-S cluster assembly regulator [Alphaproteobacteria bacterium]
MIRLSRLTDYAVALLSHMGTEGKDGLWTAADLSATSGLPMPTVAKVLKLLAKSGMIAAQRGAAGGYKLLRAQSAISVADIIEAMDGPIAITDCAEGSEHPGCNIESICPMSDGWNKVNRAVRRALEQVSLAEMSVTPASRAAPRASGA